MLKNKIIYLLLIAFVGLYSILYNSYHMWIIFLTIIFLPILLFIILVYTYRMITIEIVSPIRIVEKGESIPILVRVKNPTFFSLSNLTFTMSYSNRYSGQEYMKEMAVPVDRRTTATISNHIASKHVGILKITLSKIRIYDYIKVFSLVKKQDSEINIGVMPYLYQVSERFLNERCKINTDSEHFSQTNSGDDPSEVFDIREYRPGDRPQRIHWKLSANQDELMVKDFSEPVNCSLILFVDLKVPQGKEKLEFIDALLESTLSISYSLLQQEEIHYLAWYDSVTGLSRRLPVVTEEDLYQGVDEIFNSMVYFESMDIIYYYMAEYPNEQYTDLIFVTGELSMEHIDTLGTIDVINKQVIHIHKESSLDDLSDKLNDMGIGFSLIDMSNVKEAMEVL